MPPRVLQEARLADFSLMFFRGNAKSTPFDPLHPEFFTGRVCSPALVSQNLFRVAQTMNAPFSFLTFPSPFLLKCEAGVSFSPPLRPAFINLCRSPPFERGGVPRQVLHCPAWPPIFASTLLTLHCLSSHSPQDTRSSPTRHVSVTRRMARAFP